MSHYTTLAALKSFGSFESSDDDVLLDALIAAASEKIDNHCHRVFSASEETDHTFSRINIRGLPDPFDGNILLLDDDLAAAPSAITDNPTVVCLPENNFPIHALVLTDGAWNSTAVVVTGYWAYSISPPPDIESACLRLAKWMFDMRDTAQGSAVVVTPEGRVLLPQGLPSDIVDFLAPYRRVRVVA